MTVPRGSVVSAALTITSPSGWLGDRNGCQSVKAASSAAASAPPKPGAAGHRASPSVLAAPDHARPEPRPVAGFAGHDRSAQGRLQAPKGVHLGSAPRARAGVGCHPLRVGGLQRSVHEGVKTPPGAIAGQHAPWTDQDPIGILGLV